MSDGDLIVFFALQRGFVQTWSFLEQDNQTRLIELLRQASDEQAMLLLSICLNIPGFNEVCSARIERLGSVQLGTLLQNSRDQLLMSRAVDIYCSSRSWDQANLNYHQVIIPILPVLDQESIRRILSAPAVEGADLNGAHSFTNFIRHVIANEKMPREEVFETLRQNNMEWIINSIEAEVWP